MPFLGRALPSCRRPKRLTQIPRIARPRKAPTPPKPALSLYRRNTDMLPTSRFSPPDSPRQTAPNPAILPQSNRWTQP